MSRASRYLDRPCPTCGSLRAMLDGAVLREKRKRAGMTLRELGKRAGLTASYLCDLELNRRNLSETLFERIEKVLS